MSYERPTDPENRIKKARTERKFSQAESLATFAYLRVLGNAFV